MPSLFGLAVCVAFSFIFLMLSFMKRGVIYPTLSVMFWFITAISSAAYETLPLLVNETQTIVNSTYTVIKYTYTPIVVTSDYSLMFLFYGLGLLSVVLLFYRAFEMFKESVQPH